MLYECTSTWYTGRLYLLFTLLGGTFVDKKYGDWDLVNLLRRASKNRVFAISDLCWVGRNVKNSIEIANCHANPRPTNPRKKVGKMVGKCIY